MNFQDSSHKANWIFTKEELAERRIKANAHGIELIQKAREAAGKKIIDKPPLTMEDELILLSYYQSKVLMICGKLQLPKKVQGTAFIYIKRFYLSHSCLEYNPEDIMPTCIYLACKVEEAYYGARELCRLLQKDPEAVLRNELPVLMGLRFDLITYHPYRPLLGLFQDIADCQQQSPQELDPGLAQADPRLLENAKVRALQAADVLMQTDAPLLFPPGQLAAAALRSGFKSMKVQIDLYLKRVANQAAKMSGGSITKDMTAELIHQCGLIDQLGANQATSELQKDVVEKVNKRLRLWRKALVDASKQGTAGEDN